MLKEEKVILKISLCFSVIGLIVLFFLAENLALDSKKIGLIDRSLLENNVKIAGTIQSVSSLELLFIIDVSDETGTIPVTVWKDGKVILKRGSVVEIEGRVTEFKEDIQIEAKNIRILR